MNHTMRTLAPTTQQDSCAYCDHSFTPSSRTIVAAGRKWHQGHFLCAACGKCFDAANNELFIERGGFAYCEYDFHSLFSAFCQKCDRPILRDRIDAVDHAWHLECLSCEECRTPFNAGESFKVGPKVLCKYHSLEESARRGVAPELLTPQQHQQAYPQQPQQQNGYIGGPRLASMNNPIVRSNSASSSGHRSPTTANFTRQNTNERLLIRSPSLNSNIGDSNQRVTEQQQQQQRRPRMMSNNVGEANLNVHQLQGQFAHMAVSPFVPHPSGNGAGGMPAPRAQMGVLSSSPHETGYSIPYQSPNESMNPPYGSNAPQGYQQPRQYNQQPMFSQNQYFNQDGDAVSMSPVDGRQGGETGPNQEWNARPGQSDMRYRK
ncbi:hypothetical protein BJ741DRAFT_712978 [Chytriomyces cf. hyalinus JEL632]|nr:hypothetical protein BJ741DRAFT_712978 [Chytriomyces cf. hyalinus JEL632]